MLLRTNTWLEGSQMTAAWFCNMKRISTAGRASQARAYLRDLNADESVVRENGGAEGRDALPTSSPPVSKGKRGVATRLKDHLGHCRGRDEVNCRTWNGPIL